MSRWFSSGTALLVLPALLATGCRPADPIPDRSATLVLRNRLDPNGAPPLTTVSGLSATARYVYVGQQDEQQLLMFTAEGRFVKAIGRAGSGPGEFRALMRFGLLGDTLWSTDWTLRRLTFFNDTGSVLGTSAFEPEATVGVVEERLYQWLPESPTRDGWLLGFGSFAEGRVLAERLIDRYPLLRSTRRGTAIDTLGWYSLEHWAMILRGHRGNLLYGVQPIRTDAFVIYDGPGARACIVERDYRPVRERQSEVVVQCISANGDSLWRRTLTFEAIPVPKQTIDSIRTGLHSLLRREFLPSEVDDALHIPTHWPPVTEGLAGADGSLWLRGAVVDDMVTYTVLNRTGQSRLTIRVAAALRILWADVTTVWAEERDEDDVPVLSRYDVVFRPADGAIAAGPSSER